VALLAAYNFDEASGNILDASGNARTVTFGGSLTRVTGHTNTGLSQSTTAVDSAGPSLTGMQTAAYTIMGWVNRTLNSQDGWLLEFKQSSSGDRGILFTGGNIQSRCKNVAGTVFTVQTTQPTAGTPYHFAATNDGTTLRLFINGTEVGTGTAFSGGLRTNSTSSSFIDGLGSETWLDDARYYDTALNAATITTLMGTPVTGGTNYTQTPTDAEGLTDSRTYDLGKVVGPDAEALTDAAALEQSKAASDSLGLTDSIQVDKGLLSSVADLLGLTDSATLVAGYGQAPADPLGLTDATALDRAQVAADALSLTDTATVARGVGVSVVDPQALTDAATVAFSADRSAADSLPLTDTALVERAAAQSATDPVAITDTALVAATRDVAAADNENLTDAAALAVGKVAADNLGLTDQVVTDRAQVASDNVGLTDSASVQLVGAGTVSATDGVGLTDTAQVASVRNQVAADTCGLSDQIALVITRDLGDTITVTDAAALTAAFVRVLADNAALADTVRLDLGTQATDLLNVTDSATVVLADATAPVYGHLVATVTDPLTASASGSLLTASDEPSSRLEATNGV
jgi:hypothetical protein